MRNLLNKEFLETHNNFQELFPAVRCIPDKQKLRLKSLVFLNREMPLPSGLGNSFSKEASIFNFHK